MATRKPRELDPLLIVPTNLDYVPIVKSSCADRQYRHGDHRMINPKALCSIRDELSHGCW